MKTHQIILSTLAIASTLLVGCRDEVSRSEDSPHIATRYEDPDATWQEGGNEFDVPTTVAGGWFNTGEPPGIYLEVVSEGSDFDFDNPYTYSDHTANYFVDYFTSGNLTSSGVLSGSSISWQSTDGLDSATFTGTYGGTNLNGQMAYTWFGISLKQELKMVRVPSLYNGAAEQTINTEATYTLGPDNLNQVVKLEINDPSMYIRAETIGAGIDTWLWLFDREGNYLRQNDRSFGDADSRIEALVTQGPSFFVITQFDETERDVKLRIVKLNLQLDD